MHAKTKTPEQKKIYQVAGELLTLIDPEYAAGGHWVLQAHAMDSGSKVNKHTDDEDISFQYGVILGDFTGGELLTWSSDGEPHPPLPVSGRVVKLDGRLPHQVTPVTSGVRYSLYFYKLFDPTIAEAHPVMEPAVIVA